MLGITEIFIRFFSSSLKQRIDVYPIYTSIFLQNILLILLYFPLNT